MFLPGKPTRYVFLSVGILLVLALGGMVVYQKYSDQYKLQRDLKNAPEVAVIPPVDDVTTPPQSDLVITATGTDWIGFYEAYGEFRDYSKSFPVGKDNFASMEISWDKIATELFGNDLQKILNQLKPPMSDTVQIFRVGVVKSPAQIAGQTLYFVSIKSKDAQRQNFPLAIFDTIRGKFVVLNKIGDSGGMCSSWMECNGFSDPYLGGVIDNLVFKNLQTPNSIVIPGNDSKLVVGGSYRIPNSPDQDTDMTVTGGIEINFAGVPYKVRSTPTTSAFDIALGSVYFENGCYKYIKPDGSYKNYDLLPYFLSYRGAETLSAVGKINYDADIIWTSGQGPKQLSITGYDLENGVGCGQMYNNCTNIVNDQSWFNEDKLVKIGKTKKGEFVYELSDKATNPFYKAQFEKFGNYDPDFQYDYNGTTSVAYLDSLKKSEEKMWQKFVGGIPLVFWKDSWDKWRVYRDSQFTPGAECGKPVIYLYPEKDTDVNVKVEPNGGLTKVDPAYPTGGWTVRATPQSELTNLSDGQKYPYLFWEGKAYDMVTPDYGFVLKRAEVGERMRTILAKLGLSEKETADFLEFWQPKLEVKPFVFVTFVPQSEFDKLAPLTVSPKPDKVIRVFLDYTPLDAPVVVREPNIATPVRTGFTVVEWGGRLR